MYTKEEEEYLREHAAEDAEQLAAALKKPKRSIISKLSIMGLYKRKEYTSKTGEKPITKLELVAQLAELWGFEPDELEGLEKTPKEVLKRILAGQ